jgi:hypothetical protein
MLAEAVHHVDQLRIPRKGDVDPSPERGRAEHDVVGGGALLGVRHEVLHLGLRSRVGGDQDDPATVAEAAPDDRLEPDEQLLAVRGDKAPLALGDPVQEVADQWFFASKSTIVLGSPCPSR